MQHIPLVVRKLSNRPLGTAFAIVASACRLPPDREAVVTPPQLTPGRCQTSLARRVAVVATARRGHAGAANRQRAAQPQHVHVRQRQVPVRASGRGVPVRGAAGSTGPHTQQLVVGISLCAVL